MSWRSRCLISCKIDVDSLAVVEGSGISRVQVTVLTQCAVLRWAVFGMAAFHLHISISQSLPTTFNRRVSWSALCDGPFFCAYGTVSLSVDPLPKPRHGNFIGLTLSNECHM
jgi:hypothetical protein